MKKINFSVKIQAVVFKKQVIFFKDRNYASAYKKCPLPTFTLYQDNSVCSPSFLLRYN